MKVNNFSTNVYNYSSSPQRRGIKTNPQSCDSVSFNGHVNSEKVRGAIKYLRHETAFFREPQTDEFVKNYIMNNFAHKDKINIFCGGCSTGEEAISMSMNLDILKDKVQILGFDLGPKSIESAKSRYFVLKNPVEKMNEYLSAMISGYKDAYLAFETGKPLTQEQKVKKELFDRFFEETTIKAPEDKIGFIQRLQLLAMKKMFGYEMPKIEGKVFRLRDGMAENVRFEVGNIMDIDKMTEAEKADVITFSNALYHMTTKELGGGVRIPKEGRAEIIDELASKLRKSLNDDGIVRFGEDEGMQMLDFTTLPNAMRKYGFEPMNKTDNHAENVWRKLKD